LKLHVRSVSTEQASQAFYFCNYLKWTNLPGHLKLLQFESTVIIGYKNIIMNSIFHATSSMQGKQAFIMIWKSIKTSAFAKIS
jgi:hypothetical protein